MKRKGRPVKAAPHGTMASLGLKVTAELKAKIEQAALASGRTQSQEAGHRLEQSFQEDRIRQIVREELRCVKAEEGPQ